MATWKFASPEELVRAVERLLDARDIEGALLAAATVERDFPDSAMAQHCAGLVWERAFFERSARGEKPGIEHYRSAEAHYRTAWRLDPGHEEMHGERLFACLFVLGTQTGDIAKLREAQALCERLAGSSEREIADRFKQERAVMATAIARTTQEDADWFRATELFADLQPPAGGREAFFHHYYRGMAERESAARRGDQEGFRRAAFHLTRADAENPGQRALGYMIADCLLQVDDPGRGELAILNEIVPQLVAEAPGDTLIESLRRRWAVRQELLAQRPEEDQP